MENKVKRLSLKERDERDTEDDQKGSERESEVQEMFKNDTKK